MRKIILGTSVAVTLVLLSLGFAGAAVVRQPNIVLFPAKDIHIEQRSDGTTHLRFGTLSWNSGAGPLELRAGAIDNVNGKQEVIQRIYSDDGSYRDVKAGSFVYHPGHAHVHFDDYALYTLQPVVANGAADRISSKTTFCIIDTSKINFKLPGAPKRAIYKTCNTSMQGLSVGWGDEYPYSVLGQSIDITALPDGDYDLKIEIDPKSQIVELNDNDNISTVRVRLMNGTVTVI
jgi:hypothetical protein